jgi:hypothetical protein
LLSIVLLDPGPLESLVTRSGWKRLVALVTIVFGVGWIAFAGGLVYGSINPVVNIVKIKLDGKEATARITHVEHWVEEDDDSYHDVYRTEYTFRTDGGAEYAGVERLSWNPVDDLDGSGFDAKYGANYRVDGDTHHPLAIEFESDDPSNSRVSSVSGMLGAVIGAILGVAISAACGALGYFLCKENGEKLVAKAA